MASPSSSVGSCGSPQSPEPFEVPEFNFLPAPMAASPAESSDSREPTPEYDPTMAYNAVAPSHWDVEDFDFDAPWSVDDASITVGEEDLQPLADGELEEHGADDYSWEGNQDSSDSTDDNVDSGADEDSDTDSGEGGEDDDDDGGEDDDDDGGEDDDDDGGEDDDDDGDGDGANSSSSSGEDGDDDLPPIKHYRRSGALD
jgi:hypothetical protein